MKPKIILCFALVLSGGWVGCATTDQHHNWPVFYDCEKGPTHLLISREPHAIDFYTNEVPEWNYDLRVPVAKINSAMVNNLGEVDGLRVIEVRLVLTDMYYTDALIILEEVEPRLFLPVYVQDYSHDVSWPSESVVVKGTEKFMVHVGMDYAGTGRFHNHYMITLSPNHDPVVTESDY